MIKVLKGSISETDIKLSEVIRYAGGGDEKVAEKAKKCISHLLPEFNCKACYDEFFISADKEETDLGFLRVKSKDLAKNLDGCTKIVLFAATLGAQTDRYLQKASLMSAVDALMAQSAAAAAIEAWCDKICNHISKENPNLFLRPRFSPGYGDLSLNIQPAILSSLDCLRKIGLTSTKNLMLTPSKSVTAIVGISECDKRVKSGCAVCKNNGCIYKRSTK